jgi:cytochrome c
MQDNFNTAAGWVLFAGIVALGSSIGAGMYFKGHHVEKGGYHVEDAAPGGGGGAAASKPTDFSVGDVAAGETLFKGKCATCHTITPGGANLLGPNLHGVMGKKHGNVAGFAYSANMLAKPGNWDWQGMDAWLKSPKKYVEGTKMSFAGFSKPEDRANVIVYLNAQGSNLPVPPPPAAEAAAAPAAEGAAPDGKAAEAAPAK